MADFKIKKPRNCDEGNPHRQKDYFADVGKVTKVLMEVKSAYYTKIEINEELLKKLISKRIYEKIFDWY